MIDKTFIELDKKARLIGDLKHAFANFRLSDLPDKAKLELAFRAIMDTEKIISTMYDDLAIAGDELIKRPKVVARFAHYDPGIDEIPPVASYFILESDVPALPVHGNVSAHSLLKHGVPIPLTPTYETWKAQGSKCFRGGK